MLGDFVTFSPFLYEIILSALFQVVKLFIVDLLGFFMYFLFDLVSGLFGDKACEFLGCIH